MQPYHRRTLVLDLVTDQISLTDFCRQFPVTPDELDGLGLHLLHEAIEARDALGVECGLMLGALRGFSLSYLPMLLVLARADWHVWHDDVVSALDVLGAPEACEVLYELALARQGHRDVDDAMILGVRAVRALGQIGGRHVMARLGSLLCCGNGVLEICAAEELERLACARCDSAA